jgi:Tfp pilus assembly protein PilO
MAGAKDNPIDKLQDRWEHMTTRERTLVGALGATFVILVLSWVGFTIRDGLKAIEAKNQETRKALAALADYRVAQARGSDGPEIVIGDEAVRLESYLSSIASGVGVVIPGYNPRTPVTRNGYHEISTRIEVRGLSIYELKDFLERVESKSRVVVITQLQIKRHFREKDKVDVDMIVTTWEKAKQESAEGGAQGG